MKMGKAGAIRFPWARSEKRGAIREKKSRGRCGEA